MRADLRHARVRAARLAIATGMLVTAVLCSAAPAPNGAAANRSRLRPAHAPLAALPAARAPFSARLPAGDGRAIAERSCVLCHSAMLMTQQAKDSAGWAKTLTQMQKWGAPLNPSERDTLQAWLTTRLGSHPH